MAGPLKIQMNDALSDLMTVVDHQIGQPTFALNFIARPDGDFRQSIGQVQEALAAELPAGVFTCPLDSLHLTVAPIIWARGTYDFDVRQWWANSTGTAIDELTTLTGDSSAFNLTCAGLEVHPGAIVVRFEPSPVLDALRDAVNASDMFKDVIVEKIDFTHVTMFRFETAQSLSGIATVVARHPIPHQDWMIDHFILTQEDVYPSLRCTDSARFDLAHP